MSGSFHTRVVDRLGQVPQAIAILGKWEPFLRADRCLEEVAARGAGALALIEALQAPTPGPYLLSAEAHLRGQPRPGCLMAAEMLVQLGARRDRIRCCPASNQTTVEIRVLDRMRRQLGARPLLMLTAHYHVARTQRLLDGEDRGRVKGMQVLAMDDPLILEALQRLAPARREQLWQVIARGQRRATGFAPVAINEAVARLGTLTPGIQRRVANLIRGPARQSVPMYRIVSSGGGIYLRVAEDPQPQQREGHGEPHHGHAHRVEQPPVEPGGQAQPPPHGGGEGHRDQGRDGVT